MSILKYFTFRRALAETLPRCVNGLFECNAASIAAKRAMR
jgi:hypothetical protein